MPSAQLEPPVDIVLAGVPKSGTTSLYHALAAHPQVQASDPKETFFFSDIPTEWCVGGSFREQGWETFDRCFPGPRDGRRRLEATTVNLFQKTALTQLAALTPQPLIVVSVRCPAEQIRSNFYYHRSFGRIDESLDFATYVTALQAGDSARLASFLPDPQFLNWLEPTLVWNRYVDWLDRWMESFAADRMFVVTQRRVAHEPARVLREICDRIGVDPAFYRDDYEAPRENVTRARRVKEPDIFWRVGRKVIPRGTLHRIAARWDRQRRGGAVLGAPSEAEEVILEQLGRYFKPSNAELADRYGVDISGWRPRS